MENNDFVLLEREDAKDFNEENILPQPPAAYRAIVRWLGPTKYDEDGGEYRKHLAAHTEGTNEWLLNETEWLQWHGSSDHGLLWIKGIPGSGKSVVAANLVQKLSHSRKDVLVLFFFFRQIIDANHSPQSCIRDFLAQVLPFSPALQAELNHFIQGRKDLSTISRDDLWRLLRMGLAHQKRVYIIVDALDEMDGGNDDFIQQLAKLSRWRPSDVKILATSRPTPAMENAFRHTNALHLRLEESYVDVDIMTYVSSCLDTTSIGVKNQASIRQAIPGHANGLFLYAKLAMDELLKPGINVQEVLEKIPINLNSMFDSLLREHAKRSGVSSDFQKAVLRWVTHATRPLRLLELSEILHCTQRNFAAYNLKDIKRLVRCSCGPLIEVLPDESLSVVHHSLTEFLKGLTRESMPVSNNKYVFPVFEHGPTNLMLAHACLRYLSLENLTESDLTHEDDPEFKNEATIDAVTKQIRINHPFVTYAAANWSVHVARALDNVVSNEEVEKIYLIVDDLFAAVLKHRALQEILFTSHNFDKVPADYGYQILMHPWFDSQTFAQSSSIHVAAKAGLAGYLLRILNKDPSLLNIRDAMDNTPLHHAAQMGHSATVKMLIEQGADLDPHELHGLTPLHLAASRNHGEVVSLLLGAGVEPLTPKTRQNPGRRCGGSGTVGETPLLYACSFGHLNALAAFLPFLHDDLLVEALARSAIAGRVALVQRLIHHPGFKVDALFDGNSALYLACRERHYETIALLLDAGADPNLHCSDSSDRSSRHVTWRSPEDEERLLSLGRRVTPLHTFAGSPWRYDSSRLSKSQARIVMSETLRLLIKAGARSNVQDFDGNTPLHLALKYGTSDTLLPLVVEALIETGCDVNVANDDGERPLHRCRDDREGEILRLLIQKGSADINQKDGNNRSPLISLLIGDRFSRYEPETVLRLLSYKPDCNVTDNHGNSALHLIAKNCRNSSGVNSGEQGIGPKEKLIDALIANGADPNQKNDGGKTPLHIFSFSSSSRRRQPSKEIRTLQKFIDVGADLESRDVDGRTVLFNAIGEHEDNIKAMIDLGCQASARDYAGRSLLHELAKSKGSGAKLEKLKVLVSGGADPSLADNHGNTIFHEFAAENRLGQNPGLLEYLKSFVSPDQVNNAGQTALHVASGLVPTLGSEIYASFASVLEICKNINAPDLDGVTPLHNAAMICDVYVEKLLDRGADITTATHKGFTALHLASRARQSNIIGLICSRFSRATASDLKEFIDVRDSFGRTALHYACRSGRPESVDLLLHHGADPTIQDRKGMSPLDACIEFEDEQTHWLYWPDSLRLDCFVRTNRASSSTRRWLKHDVSEGHSYERHTVKVEHDNARLEETMKALITHSAYAALDLAHWQAILEPLLRLAAEQKREYTYHCLVEISDDLGLPMIMSNLPHDSVWVESRHDYAQKATEKFKRLPTRINAAEAASEMLYDRQFNLLRQLIRTADRSAVKCCQYIFVRWGYSELLSMSLRYASSTSVPTELDIDTGSTQKSLLIQACERRLPNIAVIKTLIDHNVCSIDEQSVQKAEMPGKPLVIYGNAALHVLAKGSEWWQVEQGIPCLLDAGADINLVDDSGMTSLHVALGYSTYEPYHPSDYQRRPYGDRAAQILISRGPNLSHLTLSGQPYLALTDNPEIIAMLLDKGAKRSVSALYGPLARGNSAALGALLRAGIDPNQIVVRVKREVNLHVNWSGLETNWISEDPTDKDRCDLREILPLHQAALRREDRSSLRKHGPSDTNNKVSMIQILLQHGADPFQTFTRNLPLNRRRLGLGLDDDDSPVRVSVLHSVLYDGGHVEPFLSLPNVNIEMRDGKDRTLFLAACCSDRHVNPKNSEPDALFLELLRSRGANIRAVDSAGNNALHLLLAFMHDSTHGGSMFTTLLEKAPELINQPNSKGFTPFHFALQCSSDTINAMIDAGADLNLPDQIGNNILHYLPDRFSNLSHQNSAPKLLQRALEKGMDINSRNLRGETLLHFCVATRVYGMQSHFPQQVEEKKDISKDLASISALVDSGADIFTRDEERNTLLHVIAKGFSGATRKSGPSVKIFRFFMGLGLDPLAENEGQSTSLDIAAANGNEGILNLFQKGGVVDEGEGSEEEEEEDSE